MQMRDTHYVGVYWLAREESAESCALRAEEFFRLLAACDPSLTRWFKKGRTLEEASQHRIGPGREDILKLFVQQERGSADGFSLSGWNGEATDFAGSSFSLRCGEPSPWMSNLCLLDLPEEGPTAERLRQVPLIAQVLRAMALAWEPEWGVATSHTQRDTLSESGEAGTFVGQLLYFSRRRGQVPPLPPPVVVEPVEDQGTLVILSPGRFTPSDPALLELAHTVSERLAQAGLLEPLQPCTG